MGSWFAASGASTIVSHVDTSPCSSGQGLQSSNVDSSATSRTTPCTSNFLCGIRSTDNVLSVTVWTRSSTSLMLCPQPVPTFTTLGTEERRLRSTTASATSFMYT